MSISSSLVDARDSILMVLEGGADADSASNSPSPFSSPEHTSGTSIRQQMSLGANLDDIILTSPLPDADDMNDDSLFSTTRDYANQDAIDERIQIRGSSPIKSRTFNRQIDRDYENQDAIDENIQIHGSSPIKSRTLVSEFDRDYENQEVLDEDIIPVSVHQPESPPRSVKPARGEGPGVSSPNESPALPRKQLSQPSLRYARKVLPDGTALKTSGSEASTPDAHPPPRPLAREGPSVPARNTTGTPRPRPSVRPTPKPRSQTHGLAPGVEEDSNTRRTPETGVGVVAPYGGGGVSDRGGDHAPKPQVDALAVAHTSQLSSSAPKPSTDSFDGVCF